MENTNYIQKSFQKFSLDPPKYDSGQGSSPLSSSPSSQSDMATIQEVCDDVQIKVEPGKNIYIGGNKQSSESVLVPRH